MIDLYFWPTPNGHKITIALEELDLPYRIVPVNIGRGEQFEPSFLAISPNNRIPAIVDHAPADGGAPVSVFESAAILLYLADKTGRLGGEGLRGRTAVTEWLTWQVANVGPARGQLNHFRNYASETVTYAVERFRNEVDRLLGVLEERLERAEFVAGDYSIADIALWPWVRNPSRYGMDLAEFPRVAAWLARIAERPAVVRALEKADAIRTAPAMDDEARKHLFGQRARTRRP